MSETGSGEAALPVPIASERTGEALLRLVDGPPGSEITVGAMTAALGERAFGILILALALPNCVFAPPGVGSITGVLVAVLAVQMACGYERPRLPDWLERRRFDRGALARVVRACLPALARFERVSRPRLSAVTRARGERWLGGFMLVQAAVVALPVPLTNWLPGVALAVMAAGLIERDGVAILVGTAVGLAAVAVAASVTGGFVAAVFVFFGFVFG